MKKLILMITIIALSTATLCGCGQKDTGSQTTNATQSTQLQAEAGGEIAESNSAQSFATAENSAESSAKEESDSNNKTDNGDSPVQSDNKSDVDDNNSVSNNVADDKTDNNKAENNNNSESSVSPEEGETPVGEVEIDFSDLM